MTSADIKALVGGRGEESTQFLSTTYFEKLFNEDQLKVAAEEAGFRKWNTTWATEKKNYLEHLMDVVEQYRLAGYSDKEILKLMQ